MAHNPHIIFRQLIFLNCAERRVTPTLVVSEDHVGADRLNLVKNVLLPGKANCDYKDEGGCPNDHAQGGKRKADFAGTEGIDRQLRDLAEEHGLSCALQRLLEGTDAFQSAVMCVLKCLLLFEFQLFGGHVSD